MNVDILVAGAGISGLTVAHGLKLAGLDVLLVEASAAVGGNMRSEQAADGFVLEHGPNTVASSSPELWQHFDQLGLGGDLVSASTAGARRYVLRQGVPVALPASPQALLRTPLLSGAAMLRLLAEPLLPRARRDESIGAFLARRLGPELVQSLVDPFVSGVFAGDPAEVSMQAAFPRLWDLEQRHGSLLRGMLFGRKKGTGRRKIFSFRGGLQRWPAALAEALAERLWFESPLVGLRQASGGWQATVLRGQGHGRDGVATQIFARRVVLALPAYSAGGLIEVAGEHANIASRGAAALRGIPYAPMAVVHLGYRREDVAHPLDGFGLLCAAQERRNILGSLWPSSLFPGRAPDGFVLTSSFIGGARYPERVQQDEQWLTHAAHHELAALLGARAAPTMTRVVRWPQAIPQYLAGHTDRIATLEQLETHMPGLHLLANYRGGISVEACWKNATALATEIQASKCKE